MRKFFVDPERIFDGLLVMDNPMDIHHIVHVLRRGVGDKTVISDGQGNDFFTHIDSIEDEKIVFAIDSIRPSLDATVKVTLFQGIPKSGKMDTIIQKTTELGVYAVIPVYMKNSVPLPVGGASGDAKLKRWQRIADEASKQSGRTLLPSIMQPLSFDEALAFLKEGAYDVMLFPYEKEQYISIKHVLTPAKNIALFIGPEGGFSDGEAEKLTEAGVHACSIGRLILRTETAGIATISMINFHYDL